MVYTDDYTYSATNNGISLTILGTRGSMPVSTPETANYGGNTSCYLIETDSEAIIIDAGTGIMNLPDTGNKRLSLLITHAHIDHVLGLPMFLATQRGKDISIYGVTRDGLTIKQQLESYISTPLWPVTMDIYGVNIDFHEIAEEGTFAIGEVTVTTMPSNHPGGSTIYRLTHNSTSITIATDYEHIASNSEYSQLASLTDFARGSDLILYDAQYTPEEYEKCRGFGHSTYKKAIELQKLANAKQMLLIHHAPNHTDEFIDNLQERINSLEPELSITFAHEGQTISL